MWVSTNKLLDIDPYCPPSKLMLTGIYRISMSFSSSIVNENNKSGVVSICSCWENRRWPKSLFYTHQNKTHTAWCVYIDDYSTWYRYTTGNYTFIYTIQHGLFFSAYHVHYAIELELDGTNKKHNTLILRRIHPKSICWFIPCVGVPDVSLFESRRHLFCLFRICRQIKSEEHQQWASTSRDLPARECQDKCDIRLLWNVLDNTITYRYCLIVPHEENKVGENTTNGTKILFRGNFTTQQQ